jgi:hypothetical protein
VRIAVFFKRRLLPQFSFQPLLPSSGGVFFRPGYSSLLFGSDLLGASEALEPTARLHPL